MKKVTIILLITLLTLFSCKKEVDSLNIGVIFPFSGPTAYMLPVKKGLDLALNEIKENNFFSDKEIKLYYVDSQSDIATAKKVMKDLENNIHPELYISLTSNVSSYLAYEAAKYKVPLMCLLTSSPKVAKTNLYTFSFYQTAKEEVKALLPIILDKKLKNIGVIYQDEVYGQSVFTESIRQVKDFNIDIHGFPYLISDSNIDNYIEELKILDGLFIVGYKRNVVVILDKLREIDYTGIILGTSTFSVKDVVTRDQADGMYIATPIIYNINYSPIANVRKKYKEVYNEPIDHFVAVGYDVLFLLAELLKNDENINRETVLSKLSSEFIYPSLYGPIEKTKDDRIIGIPLQSATIEDKELIFLVY